MRFTPNERELLSELIGDLLDNEGTADDVVLAVEAFLTDLETLEPDEDEE